MDMDEKLYCVASRILISISLCLSVAHNTHLMGTLSSALPLLFIAIFVHGNHHVVLPWAVVAQVLPGTWETLVKNAGIASMHSAVTRFGTVVLLDRTNIGASQILLPDGKCRDEPRENVLKHDCTAHSVLFDPVSATVRPLTVLTDTWCSSGQFLPDGTLLQTGGDFEGTRKIRTFSPCSTQEGIACDWRELQDVELAVGRWYATNQLLPDGRVIVVGGRGQFTAEFVPAASVSPVELPFLRQAQDAQTDTLYPFVHLLPDGNLFIFANTRAVLYDYMAGAVVREYPPLDGNPRNYPSGGSSVMLALSAAEEDDGFTRAEILVCGGAIFGAFLQENAGLPAGDTCGRITATDPEPEWAIEMMPSPRVMGDMILLPTGDVLLINGAQAGCQGFNLATIPCLNPVRYRPDMPSGLRFMPLTPAVTPRMYHSTANLLPDGRVLVAGSNPHHFYNFTGDFPTELSLDAFSPEYLSPGLANLRPTILSAPNEVAYGEVFEVSFSVELPVTGIVEFNLVSAPFSTHSFSQGQRVLKLSVGSAQADELGGVTYRSMGTAPPSPLVAPPAFYMLFLVNQGIPSVATWVRLRSSPP